MPVRAFPWKLLDATSHAQRGQVKALGRALAAVVDLPAAREKLALVSGQRASVRLRSLEPERLGMGGPEAQLHLAVAFARTPDGDAPLAGPELALVIEAEPALALRLVEGALAVTHVRGARAGAGGRPLVPAAFRPAEPELAHAFAALLAVAARARGAAADLEPPLAVAAVGTVRSLLAQRAVSAAGPSLAATYLVTLTSDAGAEAFVARLVIARAALERAAPASFDRRKLSSLGDTVLSVPVVATTSLVTPAELAALAVGDAFVPGTWPLTRVDGDAGNAPLRGARWTGPVLLAAPGAEDGTRADLTPAGDLVLRGEHQALAWTAPPPERTGADEMNEDPPASLLSSLAEAPVVVRVEIGVAELRAREWAELAPGDVVGLGRRVAEPVILRVAGREVARGELVDLDGEIGVRILSRMEIE